MRYYVILLCTSQTKKPSDKNVMPKYWLRPNILLH